MDATQQYDIRILVVDDEPTVLRLCENVLLKAGYAVTPATDVEDALAKLQAPGLRIDVALLDIVLPGRSGIALAEILASEHPEIRVVLMSGYSPADIKRVVGKDAEDYRIIWKPFLVNALIQMIDNVLNAPAAPRLSRGHAGS